MPQNIEELIAENAQLKVLITELRKRKKYGLVRETWKGDLNKQEKVVTDCQNNLPVLVEVKEKAINHNSGDDDPTHIMIEGDNYHALSTLSYTHKEKIDVIYIDPPYNTGKKNERKYNDHYVDKEDKYRHSKWLNFMSVRLRLAKDLLSEGGILLCSIDNNEIAQLKILLDDIFSGNLLEVFIRKNIGNIDNQKRIKRNHEYVLCYERKSDQFIPSNIIDPNISEDSKLYRDLIENSIIKNGPKNPISKVLIKSGFPCQIESGIINKDASDFPKYDQDIVVKDYKTVNDVYAESGRSSKDLLVKYISNNYQAIIDGKDQLTNFYISNTGAIYTKKERSDDQHHILSVLENFGTTKKTSNDLKIMGIKFPFPKPIDLISYLISIHSNETGIILDFFAGSGTTLQAVMELNKKDGGKRQCIICTNNENNDDSGGGIVDTVTYPRISKVIRGYQFTGKDLTKLFEEKLTVSKLKKTLHYFEPKYSTKLKYVNG